MYLSDDDIREARAQACKYIETDDTDTGSAYAGTRVM
jgi:hypothetical protein